MKKIFTIFILFLTAISLSAKTYHISNSGKNFIKEVEQLHLESYWDCGGYTIGYGHHGKDVRSGQHISKSQAEKLFNEDIKIFEDAANRLIADLPYEYNFSQGMFDGLVSLVYNCGEGGVRNSSFYKRLKVCRVRHGKMNRRDLKYTIATVRTTKISAKGHIERRKNEMHVMLK